MTRLRSITVSGFGCFDCEQAVGPFADGVTLVHAPNGSGKSTLVRALAMALFDSHRTGGEDVKALRPWGRADLAPTVALTLETGGRTLRVTKRFLDAPFARLEELADDGTTWRETMTADPAVEAVRALLMGQPAARGLTRAEHWGMGRVLIAPQDGMAFGGIDGDAPLESRLRDALGQARARATDPAARRLRDAVNADAATFFTDKGAVKSGKAAPPAARLAKELAAAEATVTDARARLARFDAVSADLDSARIDAAGLDARHEAATRAAASAAEKTRMLDRLRAAAAAAAARHRAAGTTLAALEKTARAETAAGREAAERDADAVRAETALPAAAAAEAAARAALETARAALAAATAAERDGSPELAAARAGAADAEAWLAAETARATRTDAIARAEASNEALIGLRARYAALGKCPDAAAMTALRATDTARRDARQALAAAMATLTFTPEPGTDPARLTTLAVVEGDPADDVPPPGALTARGAPAAAIAVPGLGVFRAGVPSDSGSDDRRRAVEVADAGFDRLRAPYESNGVALGLPALEARHAVAAALKQEGLEAAATLAGLLGVAAPRAGSDGLSTALASALAAVRAGAATAAGVERLLADHPAWAAAPPDDAALAEARARVACLAAAARQAADTARAACEPAEVGHRHAATDLARAAAAAESARREAAAARARLAAARDEARRAADAAIRDHPAETAAAAAAAAVSADAGQAPVDHAALIAALDRLNRTADHDLRDADAALAAANSATAAPAAPGRPDNPASYAEADPETLAALRDERRTARDRLAGELSALGETAPYAALAAAEETAAVLRGDLAREGRRMDAARLLKQLFDDVDTAARSAVSAPLADDATAWFHRLTGTPRLGAVILGRGLAARSVAPPALSAAGADGAPGGPGWIDAAARLSGGEHEQLQLAVRLALARHLAAGAGVPFVLDDAMPATDAARFARVREALAAAGTGFPVQILLFTCHPERYAGWPALDIAAGGATLAVFG